MWLWHQRDEGEKVEDEDLVCWAKDSGLYRPAIGAMEEFEVADDHSQIGI